MTLFELSASLKVAADLNNGATGHIRQREYSSALSMLSKALVTMKMALRKNKESSSSSSTSTFHPHQGTSSTTSSSSSSSSLSLLHFASEEEDFDCSISSFSSSKSCTASKLKMMAVDDDWYLYCDPIQVTSFYYDSLLSSPFRVEILSYAIIYNLALCHHLIGLLQDATTSTPTIQLQKAISFYNHAQRMMVSNNALELEMIHSLVITNNMGHVYHCLNNEPSAKVCFQRLLSVIMYLSESGQEGRQLLSDNEPCFDCFLTNIMHIMTLGGTCGAPAA